MTGPRLYGRDAELAALAELIEQASERGSAIAVLGEAGTGKSTLLRAAVELARSAGFQVLQTAGVETEANLPFAGLHQLMRPLLDMADAADALPSTQRRALFAAFGDDEGSGAEPFLIALAALNLLAEASAQRPLLVAVDDVQWLDRPTHEAGGDRLPGGRSGRLGEGAERQRSLGGAEHGALGGGKVIGEAAGEQALLDVQVDVALRAAGVGGEVEHGGRVPAEA